MLKKKFFYLKKGIKISPFILFENKEKILEKNINFVEERNKNEVKFNEEQIKIEKEKNKLFIERNLNVLKNGKKNLSLSKDHLNFNDLSFKLRENVQFSVINFLDLNF